LPHKIFYRGFEFELQRLGSSESYFKTISVDLQRKRDYIARILQEVGMNPVIPEGGYFIMADWSKMGELIQFPDV
jgi:kynurenine--oxoglutarate transaminase/cysteine-S-conjugate beta-lyase/glutamine--phenylpyruvate transaminase